MLKKVVSSVLVMMSLLLALPAVQAGAEVTSSEQAAQAEQAANPCISAGAMKLKEDMRKLWMEHTIWTSKYIVSAAAGLKDKDKVLARLLRNQEDLGNAIKPFYGDAAGNKLTELLKEHIVLAGKIVDAAKRNKKAELKKLNDEWHRNADDIAKFLSSANPNLPEATVKELMYTHLQMMTDEATTRIKKDWDGNITAFDHGLDHIIKLADALSAGIIKQFPSRF
ncbi:glycosyltransferase [Paenibacillus aestuarii]|uniref:Glycosyltransferase n=1 Tax=Paenibacillus aestuarii TaxID=516965 RepID=A0ABW0KH56_9BACL|nr:glycosyltransferase [Paenibacillus aestuarii]